MVLFTSNNYCRSTATLFTRMRPNDTFIRTLPVVFLTFAVLMSQAKLLNDGAGSEITRGGRETIIAKCSMNSLQPFHFIACTPVSTCQPFKQEWIISSVQSTLKPKNTSFLPQFMCVVVSTFFSDTINLDLCNECAMRFCEVGGQLFCEIILIEYYNHAS